MVLLNTVTAADESHDYSLAHGWRTLAIAGGVVGLLGLLAIAFPFATGLSVTVGLGILLVLGGIVHGAHAFTARGWSGSLWQIALGVVSIVAGLALLASPVVGLVTLTILAIAYLLVDAVAELWMAVRMADQPGRLSVAASGLVSLVLAGLLWAGFPADAAWAVGLLVGIGLFVTGLSMAIVAITGRDAAETTASATEPRSA
ncbi:HdeD family acid-resistance protein [Natrialbaceae archaeon A-arb3/5]